MKQCACGWRRPIISVTTTSGRPPPDDVIPVYNCPYCGASYVPEEIPEHLARRIIRDLVGRSS